MSTPGDGVSGKASRYIVWTLWFLVLGAIPFVAHFDQPGWDFAVYRHAVESVRAGHDPYADAIAAQEAVHKLAPGVPTPLGPFSYVYSPITLPLLRLFAAMPLWLGAILFGVPYVAAVGAMSWFGLSLMEEEEWRVLRFFVPAAIFFPGFLGSDTVLGGNVAFILYGAVLVAIARAVRTGCWWPFYTVVVIASCFKAPLLYLVVIPLLCARRQWQPAAIASVAGVMLFAIQPVLWPQLFRNYLEAVGLVFSFNRDFGSSPSGLFSGWLYDHHFAYLPTGLIFHLCCALPVLGMLIYLSRRYLNGELTAQRWLPVMLIGVVLLNPRLIEYDVAALGLPMAIVCWRLFRARYGRTGTLARVSGVFLALNLIATRSWSVWKLTEGPVLAAMFLCGAMTLVRTLAIDSEPVAVEAMLTEA